MNYYVDQHQSSASDRNPPGPEELPSSTVIHACAVAQREDTVRVKEGVCLFADINGIRFETIDEFKRATGLERESRDAVIAPNIEAPQVSICRTVRHDNFVENALDEQESGQQSRCRR